MLMQVFVNLGSPKTEETLANFSEKSKCLKKKKKKKFTSSLPHYFLKICKGL